MPEGRRPGLSPGRW